MNKEILRRFIFTTSCAFTVVVLSFTILPVAYVPNINATVLQQTLCICAGTAIAAEISSRYPYRHTWTSFLIPFLFVTFTVFFIGGVLLQLIPFEIETYTTIPITILIVYIICYYGAFEKNKNDAEAINKQLKRKGDGK